MTGLPLPVSFFAALLLYSLGFHLLFSKKEWVFGTLFTLLGIVAAYGVMMAASNSQRGTPMSFSELITDKEYRLEKRIDDNLFLIRTPEEEIKIVKDAPKALSSLNEGETFKMEDIPSLTSKGRFIAPMITSQ